VPASERIGAGKRADHGVFANADQAIAAWKEIVDDELNTMWKPGTTAKQLYSQRSMPTVILRPISWAMVAVCANSLAKVGSFAKPSCA
jgi:hypothetical protein